MNLKIHYFLEDKKIKCRKETINVKSNLTQKEMKQIEKWTKLKMKEIIFDSKIHNWKEDESNFDSKILNKSNLLFLIDFEGIKFGGFISSKIDKIDEWIKDDHAFIFTFKDNKPMKFDIKKDKKDKVFYLYSFL